MIPELIAGGFLLGEFIYHRWIEEHDEPPSKEIKIPRQEEGGAIPLVFGQVRVRQPYVGWYGNPQYSQPDTLDPEPSKDRVTYGLDMLFHCGIGFNAGGYGINKLHGIFVGEERINEIATGDYPVDPLFSDLSGDGDFEPSMFCRRDQTEVFDGDGDLVLDEYASDPGCIGGFVEWLNGNPNQLIIDPVTTEAKCYLGLRLSSNPVPGAPHVVPGVPGGPRSPLFITSYRGYMSAFLHHADTFFHSGVPEDGYISWFIGTQPQPGSYNFEVSSIPLFPLILSGPFQPDVDANPADVLYDLLAGRFGKLRSLHIDSISFRAAAVTLLAEGHGFSRSFEELETADDMIAEILRQIDGLIYEDPATGLIKLKLIRGDYTFASCRVLNEDNIDEMTQPALGGRTDLVNLVRVIFTDRENSYREDSCTAQNQASAVGQDGVTNELVLRMPGICARANAETVAARELSIRSRPLFKCSVKTDQSFYDVNPGDVVRITWGKANLNDILMRVAGSSRGERKDKSVVLDLIQDFCTATRSVVIPPVVTPFPPLVFA